MGISGLTPFLIKTCPHVVRELPDRFASFVGKTIAIDGTLITQRFWFSPDPHQYRHVRGWHRLLRELHKSDIKVICVFDGVTRTSAKSGELRRRQVARNLLSSRAVVEEKRGRRLNSLSHLWRRFRDLDQAQKIYTATSIVDLAHCYNPKSKVSVHDRDTSSYFQEYELEDGPDDVTIVPPLSASDALLEEAVIDEWVHHRSHFTAPAEAHEPVSSTQGTAPENKEDPPTPASDVTKEGLAKRIAVLYRGYKRSLDGDPSMANIRPSSVTTIPDLVDDETISLYIPPTIPDTVPEPLIPSGNMTDPNITEDDSEEAKTEAELTTMSKTQTTLTVEEGRIWASLLLAPPSDEESGSPSEAPQIKDHRFNEVTQRLYELSAISDKLNQSYAKRIRAPTGTTYAESRTILKAMGAVVIDAPYPYEAEGVAASLCVHGIADAVGSEDTDVIVYEAPLLRRITSREDPLMYVSGREVREALNLSRPSFVDFALLLGSDFTQRLAGLGPSRAIKLIQSKGSIEAIVQSERTKETGTKFLPEPKFTEEEYLKQVEAGRMVFQTLPPISEDLRDELTRQRDVDESAVAEVLKGFDLSGDLWNDLMDDVKDPLQVDYYDPALQSRHGDYIYF
ncbi:hypothetical protein FRB93_013332 [Tulasnella sp. JGI-2019a]|nr:hypothetical protein FRB93_013332 [Tulasnella sp. JGI-2019a]